MAEPYLGEIRIFAFDYPPVYWADCNGQLVQISQNQALYALLGTRYGGNGTTTFGLPDLQGRLPMHLGNGPGLTPRILAQKGGAEQVTITTNQMPAHTHAVQTATTLTQTAQATATLVGATDSANANSPEGNNLAAGTNLYRSSPRTLKNMAASSIAVTQPAFSANTTVNIANNGGGHPTPTMPPFMVLRFCIALQGLFPQRD